MQQRSLQQVRVSVSLIFLIHGLIIATCASRKLARLVNGELGFSRAIWVNGQRINVTAARRRAD
jgi:hypothetical protein